MAKKPSLAKLCRQYLEARERGKSGYQESDELLEQIQARNKPKHGKVLGGKFRHVDNFAAKNRVFRSHGMSRFDIEEVKTES